MAMIERSAEGVYLRNGQPVRAGQKDTAAREKTLAYKILHAHEKKAHEDGMFRISYDALISHDITYVNIIQTARASGMQEFPLPYALTNCHNSLCAVGGTINKDDHMFGLSAAKKYGGIYVPANVAVIHQFAREKLTGCGKMILGSDSHTRYGCYGTMAVGEGGGELTKQLLNNTWDVADPEVVLVWVDGEVPHGIGPHDVALALVKATFPDGFVKNRILEFAGPGIEALSMDFRIGIDVMTTETSCLSSIWETDEKVKAFYENVGRPEDFKVLATEDGAYYDRLVTIHLSEMESMIALPFHPSNAYTIHELQEDPEAIFKAVEAQCDKALNKGMHLDLLRTVGADHQVHCDQGIIAGCAGGMYENLVEAAAILKDKSVGNGYFDLSVYPSSMPIEMGILKDGTAAELTAAGAVLKPCFCGPCFGAGDTPANNTLSIRHTTRNFANREGSKPGNGQIAAVALMDARSIAATAANGGILTAATDIDYEVEIPEYVYTDEIYEKRVYNGVGRPDPEEELRFGPNIKDWPVMPKPKDDLILKLCAVIRDPVTTTDELIPSGETSSFRSNPIALSDFALSRRVPTYVADSKKVRALEEDLLAGRENAEVKALIEAFGAEADNVTIGSCVFSNKPGDGSAREQAASCQKVLGGFANICFEYATKRYRSNCINWGIVPFTLEDGQDFPYETGSAVYVKDVIPKILAGEETFPAKVLSDGKLYDITLTCRGLSDEEKQILAEGCLMNYYKAQLN